MRRTLSADRASGRPHTPARSILGLTLAIALVAVIAGADGRSAPPAVSTSSGPGFDLDTIVLQSRGFSEQVTEWYQSTPPADRVSWGGMAAAAGLGLFVLFERTLKLRRDRILPGEFSTRFLGRLESGKLDRGKALDFCELNPSPASRVALAAVRRWGRPVTDLERAVALAHRVEADHLRRNVGTLRRVAALTPLLGLLGTLMVTGRTLSSLGSGTSATTLGPGLAMALNPLIAGVTIAILAMVAYDGLAGRVEKFVGALESVGAQTIDAIALSLPGDFRPVPMMSATVPPSTRTPHQGAPQPSRAPHQIRMEVPTPTPQLTEDEEAFD